MISTRWNKGLVTLMIGSYLTSVTYGANIPSGQGSHLGIMQVGKINKLSERRAYEIVEMRLERWLENSNLLVDPVRKIPAKLSSSELQTTKVQLDLKSSLENLQYGWENSKLLSGQLEKIRKLRNWRMQISHSSFLGPQIQKALLWESILEWHSGKHREAKSLVKKALKISPVGNIDLKGFRSGLEALKMDAEYRDLVSDVSRQVKKDCLLYFSSDPDGAEVWVNGYPLGPVSKIHLSSAASYLIKVSFPGYYPLERSLVCKRQGKRQWKVSLKPLEKKSVQVAQELSELHQHYNVKSFCFIQKLSDQFRFFLYTPGFSVDEIPLEKGLRVAQVLEDPLDKRLPIISDAFAALAKKHRIAKLSGLGSAHATWNYSPDHEGHLLDRTDSGPKHWYESWTFWAVAGGIVGGLVVAHLASRNHNVKSQSNNGLHIKVDW